MKFDLKRPCAECPFRCDIRPYLTAERAREIISAIVPGQQTFACHKTVDYEQDSDGVVDNDSQHCAGALILLEKIERPNQMMRIAERLGLYDRRALDMTAPIFDNTFQFVKANS